MTPPHLMLKLSHRLRSPSLGCMLIGGRHERVVKQTDISILHL